MWTYNKMLQYPINIKCTDPRLAKVIISQYGGPDGELAASLGYLSQRFGMPDQNAKAILNDIRYRRICTTRLSLYLKTNENIVIKILWGIIKNTLRISRLKKNYIWRGDWIMKVAEVKLQETDVKFYDDFSENAGKSNLICFQNMLFLMLQEILQKV